VPPVGLNLSERFCPRLLAPALAVPLQRIAPPCFLRDQRLFAGGHPCSKKIAVVVEHTKNT